MRILSWFSCGAASAVATKKAIELWGDSVVPVYCDTMATEHPDNKRFLRDVEQWIGREVTIIKSDKYATVDEVFEKTRYMAGIQGARCTSEMKKIPRQKFAAPDDVHVFGFTAEEGKRIREFERRNLELICRWPLRDAGLSKMACLMELERAGIAIPVMYRLGYVNNNCIGCVKATSAKYWDRTRRDFPDVFARRVRQSRDLGVRLTRYKGKRIFLDELPVGTPYLDGLENISCGPDCGGG